jgi:hypothetical protein
MRLRVHPSGNELAALLCEERWRTHLMLTAVLAVAMLLASPIVLGEEVRINRCDCAAGVHVVAREAHLSEVLKGLAQSLDFQLSFEADSDPLIDIDAAMRPAELIARLTPDGNLSATESNDPACSGQTRIVKLWVLSSARKNGQRPLSTAQRAPQVQEIAAQPDQTQQVVQTFLAETHGLKPATPRASP